MASDWIRNKSSKKASTVGREKALEQSLSRTCPGPQEICPHLDGLEESIRHGWNEKQEFINRVTEQVASSNRFCSERYQEKLNSFSPDIYLCHCCKNCFSALRLGNNLTQCNTECIILCRIIICLLRGKKPQIGFCVIKKFRSRVGLSRFMTFPDKKLSYRLETGRQQCISL